MQLFTRLRWPWVFSMGAAGLGLLATLVVVWYAGATMFANYAIDMAKLSLVVLLLELVPSPYAIIRSQQDEMLKRDLATFSLAGGALAIVLVALLAAGGLFEAYSNWMLLYVAYVAMQRYFDVKLQAEGRLREYFQLTSAAVALRVLLLVGGFLYLPEQAPNAVIWGALALGSAASLFAWLLVRPGETIPFLRPDHLESGRRLFGARRAYLPYYVNVSLKRVRDSAMPILCGALVADGLQVARYLLAYRGLDFVCGQLRLAEALLGNLAVRREMRPMRAKQFLLLAVLGQITAFAASAFLAAQTGLDEEIFLLSIIASFFVYPYVVELINRSDAYAEEQPWRVTISLTAFVCALAIVMSALALFDALVAPTLILAPLAGQSAAALTYMVRWSAKDSVPRRQSMAADQDARQQASIAQHAKPQLRQSDDE